jgi:hypothetical protein
MGSTTLEVLLSSILCSFGLARVGLLIRLAVEVAQLLVSCRHGSISAKDRLAGAVGLLSVSVGLLHATEEWVGVVVFIRLVL